MKKHILIVGVDEINTKELKDILVPFYRIDIVNSAEKIIEFLEIANTDLILVDLNKSEMMKLNRVYSIKKKEVFKDIPVVFVIEALDEGLNTMISEEENIDIILKPIMPNILLNRVRVQMELSEHRRDINDVLKEKTKTIENLQDVMMMSIAELVECRDETTGGHVKRTANYVEVLVKALVERKIYKDILVPSYVKDMIRSAPLHDLGKIGISDNTLLKNGSLDEEEFEYMKTHSVLGGKTIQKMIDQTMEGSFLDVAKEMANYHHEKWDGGGYPDGLKGEEIPVSARVMAIADIYDALTTKRPYKEELSHEEAVDIILKGKGNSFDPVILKVFEDIHQEFEKIKNNN